MYLVAMHVEWAFSSTGGRFSFINYQKFSAPSYDVALDYKAGIASQNVVQDLTIGMYLGVGDVIVFNARHTAGGTLSISYDLSIVYLKD